MTPQANIASKVVFPGQGRVVRAFGDEITFVLDGAATGGKYTQFIDVTPPGGGPPPHYHANEDELFLVLEGRVEFLRGGQWTEGPVGTTVFMPRNEVHTFRNAGDKPSKLFVTTSPSGFENFFTRCGEEFAKSGGPDMRRILEISAEHGIHFPKA